MEEDFRYISFQTEYKAFAQAFRSFRDESRNAYDKIQISHKESKSLFTKNYRFIKSDLMTRNLRNMVHSFRIDLFLLNIPSGQILAIERAFSCSHSLTWFAKKLHNPLGLSIIGERRALTSLSY